MPDHCSMIQHLKYNGIENTRKDKGKSMTEYSIEDYFKLLKQEDLILESNITGFENNIITNLTYNSKEVTKHTLFICKGVAFKAEYLNEALKKGACFYISEKKYDLDVKIPYIIVKDIRIAMPIIADKFYGSAWKDLNLIGITGTKGKSTTAYYIKSILDDYLDSQNKKESAVISSIDLFDGVIQKESHITTPEAMELHHHFRNAANSGIEYLQMEVSSQALKYNRVDGILFDVGVFLNISEDHISPMEHQDFSDYFNSKLKMFAQTKTACVNLDSDFSEQILESAKASEHLITFGTKETADIYGYDIRKEKNEIIFKVKCDRFHQEFKLTMPGLFNVENALAAITIAYVLHIPVEYIYSGLYKARSSGRMELYASKDQKVIAIVDYAHNKLSFDKLFSSTRKEYPDYDIVSIFGCPGKKALIRRRDLGTIAGQYSKKVYLVAEDPGYEPVEDISKDIAQYVAAQNCEYAMIEDRGEAIKAAIEEVTSNTVILITGKGNETRQKYGSEYLDCPSDVEYTKKYIEEYNKRMNLS